MTHTISFFVVVLVASFCRSLFGFGDGLVGMPPITLLFGPKFAAPLLLLVAIQLGVMILWQSWRKFQWRLVIKLLLASVAGLPFGFLLLKHAPEGVIKMILGIFLILFALYSLFGPKLPQLKSRFWVYGFGFFAGCLASSYNIPGPLVVAYGTMVGWSTDEMRSNLQGYFLPLSFFTLFGHHLSGNLTVVVWEYYLYCIPLVLLGFFLGVQAVKRVSVVQFQRYLYLLLIIMGGILII